MSVSAPHKRPYWHDAYDAQMALWRWYRQGSGSRWLAESERVNTEFLIHQESRELMDELYAAEYSRLLDLDPIYVSEDMCEVVEAARESFHPEPLLETDLLTTHGFLFFARPFLVPDRFERPTSIQAASWTLIYSAKDEEEKLDAAQAFNGLVRQDGVYRAMEEVATNKGLESFGIALTLYAKTDPERLHGGVLLDYEQGGWPPVVPMHLTPWYFGMSFDGNEWDEAGVPTGAEWWWRTIQSSFRLMQQRLAHKGFYRPDRATRRAGKKLGIPDEREVVVVRLRREQPDQPAVEGVKDVEWTHRWIVSGHWRNQPYPSEGIYRQIWISPYVKGPEDKPLIVRPRRVFQWDR